MGRCETIVKRLIIEDGLLLTDMELTFRGIESIGELKILKIA